MQWDNLKQGERLEIWQRFQDSPEWGQLCKELQKKKLQTPIVTNADTREAFFYAAIRNQVIDELLLLPSELVGHIQRAMK